MEKEIEEHEDLIKDDLLLPGSRFQIVSQTYTNDNCEVRFVIFDSEKGILRKEIIVLDER